MLRVLNSYIIQKATAAKKLPHQIFRREQLAKQLVQYLIPEAPTPPLRLPEGSADHFSLFRLTARHFPRPIEPKPGRKRKKKPTERLRIRPLLIVSTYSQTLSQTY
ncbi:hypothetical protein ElyMa_002951300 [Elysia marginata]|uniref:Uncharacterized protein n=1 Tax=Elysia marginata TaxID=1093978 RepID=A0AAV4I6F7_9GAST|nr:hypothetical protein ElyMa_002951300 [Elysia marginata]